MNDEKRPLPIATVMCALIALWAPLAAAQPDPSERAAVSEAERAAVFPDLGEMKAHGMLEDPFNRSVLFDELEGQDATGPDPLIWDATAWFGHAFNRLAIRSEGERRAGATERAELQFLFTHTVARWWDVVAGVREDFEPGPSQHWVAFGLQGLAPYRFDVEATAFVGDAGRAAARFKAEYELLITNRLILQPLLELNWYAQADAPRGLGSGLATSESGLRLRYAFRRELAPYVGLVREKKFGSTADIAHAAALDTQDTRLVAGVRLRF